VNSVLFGLRTAFLLGSRTAFYSGCEQQYIIYFDILLALLTVSMQLTVSAKQIGRKHPLIARKVIEIEDIGANPTVQRLIEAVMSILPVHSQHRGRIFLPFVDEDPRSAELLSKVLLLARDQEIKDPVILDQLR
jgi:hypothetical protein